MPWMLVILVLQEADAKMDLEVREFLGLIPVKEEAGRVSEEVPSGTCERSSPFGAGSRVGREESQMGVQLSESRGQPSGVPWSRDGPPQGSHIVPQEGGSRMPAHFRLWLPGEMVPLGPLNAVTDLEAATEGWWLTAPLLQFLSSKKS